MHASHVHGPKPTVTPSIKLHDIEPNVVLFTAAEPYAEPGVFNSNYGIVTFSDRTTEGDEIIMLAANTTHVDALLDKGYRHDDSLPVEIGAGQTEHERDVIWPQLALDKVVQATSLKNREATYTDSEGVVQRFITEDPFDTGEYVELSRLTVESRPDGIVTSYEDTLSELMKDEDFLRSVGKYNDHDGVLTWTTAAGHVQIAPMSKTRVTRLEAMGYVYDATIPVPHSHGEQWLRGDDQPQIRDVVTGEYVGTAAEVWQRLVNET